MQNIWVKQKYCGPEVCWEHYSVMGALFGIIWQLSSSLRLLASSLDENVAHFTHTSEDQGWQYRQFEATRCGFEECWKRWTVGARIGIHFLPITLFCLSPQWEVSWSPRLIGRIVYILIDGKAKICWRQPSDRASSTVLTPQFTGFQSYPRIFNLRQSETCEVERATELDSPPIQSGCPSSR